MMEGDTPDHGGGTDILVVDDDKLNRMMIRRTLGADPAFQLTFAASGAEALETCAEGRFDLILLDAVMPPPDGAEVLAELRSRRSMDRVPVVIYTAETGFDTRERYLALGADDVLDKSNPFTLGAALNDVLDRGRDAPETAGRVTPRGVLAAPRVPEVRRRSTPSAR